MKYCKRCFRNIDESYTKCPFCNQSDKLIDYSSKNSGEQFECSEVEQMHKDNEKDAYIKSYELEGNKDPYDNSEKENIKSFREVLDNEMQGMTLEEKQAYIRKKIAEKQRTLNIETRGTAKDCNDNAKNTIMVTRTYSVDSSLDTFPKEKKPLIMPLWGRAVYAIVTLANPFLAIIAFAALVKIFKDDTGFKRLGILMIIISIAFCYYIRQISYF